MKVMKVTKAELKRIKERTETVARKLNAKMRKIMFSFFKKPKTEYIIISGYDYRSNLSPKLLDSFNKFKCYQDAMDYVVDNGQFNMLYKGNIFIVELES